MTRRRIATASAVGLTALAAVTATAASALGAPARHGSAPEGHGQQAASGYTYTVGAPRVDAVQGGPWTLAQGDPTVGGPYGGSLPVYASGGSPTFTLDGVTYPNLAVDPGSGAIPYQSGFAGTPGPLPGYCSSAGPSPEHGVVLRQPAGSTLPMQPYYFPFVTSDDGGKVLTGYFDYRPKDADEAVVAATSRDHGRTWRFVGQALELNRGVCPNGDTVDDGQGHPFVMTVPDAPGAHGRPGGKAGQLLYTLSRPSGDTLGVSLIVHRLTPKGDNPLAGLPASEPVGMGGSTKVTAGVWVPYGPGNGVTISVGSTANFESSGQFFVDGQRVLCSDAASTDTTFTGCTTTDPYGLTVRAGDKVAAPPVIPADAMRTSGLIAPDGIISTLPRYPGAPKGAVAVLYTEKIVDYYTPTTTTADVTLPASTIPVASTARVRPDKGVIDVSLGTAAGIQQVSCTGESATSLTGCTGGTGTVTSGSDLGIQGAAVTPYAVLHQIGEGKNKPKKLFGNNEDYTVVRAAYTYDGLHFRDLGIVKGLNDPASNSDSVLRWVGSRGTVVRNPDGTLGLFQSGAYASDGDSDAFDQIFYSSSADGEHWSAPTKLLGTDYTFGALRKEATRGGQLGVAAYYSGRVYDPTVVPNGDGTLTMVFAGYSTPKPLPHVGDGFGTDAAARYTVPASAPALYRTILSVTLYPERTRR